MINKSLICSILLVFAVITIVLINSCSKVNMEDKKVTDVSNDILSFSNEKNYLETLNKVLSMNPQELEAYEDSKGYKSFGRFCDEIYQSINPEDFRSIEEIKAFVSQNSKYLQLIEDENGEFTLETVLSNNPNRYLITNDRLFIINNNVYKVFDKGIVTTQIEKIESLMEISSNNYLNYAFNENIRFMPVYVESVNESTLKDAAYDCGTYARKLQTNGNNRTLIEISITYWDTYDIGGIPMTILRNRVFVKPQKRTIFWFNCTRTISCDVKIAMDYETVSGWQRDFVYHHYDGTSPEWNYELIISGGTISWGYWARYNMHYGACDCWGETPDTDPAKIRCNIELF